MTADVNKLKYSKEVSIFTCSVLKRLKAYKFDTFEDRIRNQKLHYLSQLFKVSPEFTYNLYIKGPYSPELTNTLYYVKDLDLQEDISVDKFVIEDLECNFKELELFVKDKSNRELELLTTLHWLWVYLKLNKVNAIIKLKELKNATDDEIKKTTTDVEVLKDAVKNKVN